MRPLLKPGRLRPIPDCCSRGATTSKSPIPTNASTTVHKPGEEMPSSLVNRMRGVMECDMPLAFENAGYSVISVESRTEHSRLCSGNSSEYIHFKPGRLRKD